MNPHPPSHSSIRTTHSDKDLQQFNRNRPTGFGYEFPVCCVAVAVVVGDGFPPARPPMLSTAASLRPKGLRLRRVDGHPMQSPRVKIRPLLTRQA